VRARSRLSAAYSAFTLSCRATCFALCNKWVLEQWIQTIKHSSKPSITQANQGCAHTASIQHDCQQS
jgi:hypothetical protein